KWSKTAESQLRKISRLNKDIAQQIVTKLDEISNNPYLFTEKLSGLNLRKLRVGNYRVILYLEGQKMVIFIVQVGPRSNIYEKL
ncbi:MAG TPA: type II toxin-antitoxin system RelE/ParE family toxin, partial [Candidatus Nitrosotalea sp.]|nr:type II toxin-antitoxin system RelE/ParE family toxin [Candidatus Nitrosotalea sp.]